MSSIEDASHVTGTRGGVGAAHFGGSDSNKLGFAARNSKSKTHEDPWIVCKTLRGRPALRPRKPSVNPRGPTRRSLFQHLVVREPHKVSCKLLMWVSKLWKVDRYDGAPNSMMLHPLLLYPNSLSLSSWTMAGCSGDVIDSDPSSPATATGRRASHALKPIPLSHNF